MKPLSIKKTKMKKRVRDLDGKHDPFDVWHMVCLTWLWVVKSSPLIRNCVNHDVARKIVSLIKIDLSTGIFWHEVHFVLCPMFADHGPFVWSWRSDAKLSRDIRPCVQCLRPVSLPSYDPKVPMMLVCSKCVSKGYHGSECASCCGKYKQSMCPVCIENFRDCYILPVLPQQYKKIMQSRK